MPRDPILGDLVDSTDCYAYDHLRRRLAQKGDKSFISPGEAFGTIIEEYLELQEAVHRNSHGDILKEVLDIYVPCIFELATKDIDRKAARIKVQEASLDAAHARAARNLIGSGTHWSIHDLLSSIARDYRMLEDGVFNRETIPDTKGRFLLLAFQCLRGAASVINKKMDW